MTDIAAELMTNWPAWVWGVLLTLTLATLIALLFYRGWMINEIDRRCTEDHKVLKAELETMRAEWEAFRVEQEKWHDLVRDEQKSPWDIHRKQRSA